MASQDDDHTPYGGVVPEIAARAHMSKIDRIIDQAIREADVDYADLSAIAATSGPGLIGGVITGLMAAKGLSPNRARDLLTKAKGRLRDALASTHQNQT